MADPVVHITNGIPDLGTGNITTLGMTLSDGANATLGSSADAAVTAGAAGTINAHLRSISRDLVSGIALAPSGATIGAVAQAGAPWSENISQFGGAAVVTGIGVGGAGIPRVTVSSDSSFAATQSGTWNINNITGTISLPTGAASSAKQPALGTGGSPAGDVLTIQGISTMTPVKVDGAAGSFPVTGTVTANQGGTWNLTNISGTISLPTGAATAAKQPALGTAGISSTDVISVQGVSGMTPVSVNVVGAGSGPVSTTGTTSNVAATTTSTTILASNPNRMLATVMNDSASANLFLMLAAGTASATNFTVKLVPGAYYELPIRYTGIMIGIWDAAVGAARVTELT